MKMEIDSYILSAAADKHRVRQPLPGRVLGQPPRQPPDVLPFPRRAPGTPDLCQLRRADLSFLNTPPMAQGRKERVRRCLRLLLLRNEPEISCWLGAGNLVFAYAGELCRNLLSAGVADQDSC